MRRIADALMALQQHGSGDYISWEMTFPCRLPNVVEQLQHVANKLECDLEQWKREIQEQRDHFYELNYYTTQQLLLLREELGRLHEPGVTKVKPEAMALLQSISRDVPGDVMKEYVHLAVTRSQEQNKSVLKSTKGHHGSREEAGEQAISTHQPSDQPVQSEPQPLDPISSSSSSVVVVDLLKSEAGKTFAPLAQKQENDLSNEQRAILVNVMNSFGFHQQLVLLAMERCANPMDFKTVAAWCTDNEDQYTYGDEEEKEDEEKLSDEEELMEQEISSSDREDNIHVEGDARSSMEVGSGPGELGTVIVRKHITVDEHHPVVKEMIKLGYPLEQCLLAAQRHPDDSHAAYRYLMENEEQSDMFGAPDSDLMEWSSSGPLDVKDQVPGVSNVARYINFNGALFSILILSLSLSVSLSLSLSLSLSRSLSLVRES